MLELHQFELSHYCEKVRLILDYKGLEYRKVEIAPGVGQVEIYQLSGQRQVPVLKDGPQVIAGSGAIARYLDQHYPNNPIIPAESRQRGLCLLLADWADTVIGPQSRKVAFAALSHNSSFRAAVLPKNTPDLVKRLVETVPGELLEVLGIGVGASPEGVKTARATIAQGLESLTLILQQSPYLVGDQPTLADFAVACLSMYLKIPAGPYLDIPAELRGKGVPGLADDPAYQAFFNWRQQLYVDYRHSTSELEGAGPTAIQID